MTTTLQQFNVSPWLTAVRLVATTNVSGTYYNGQLNNGVGATLTVAATSLTIDSVLVEVGDRVLLTAQTAANENGIYFVNSIDTSVVLQRSGDQQSLEQYRVGQYVSVGAGTANGGTAWVQAEPLPSRLGIDNMAGWTSSVGAGTGTAATKTASNNGLTNVSSVSGATTLNGLTAFADTAGTVKDPTATSTSGFGLTAATGNLVATTGNVVAGSSGNAGTVSSFPGTAANGSLKLAGVNAGGAFNTTISNGTMGQSTVYTVGDIGAATGAIPVATVATRMKWVSAAAAAGGAAAQSFTDAFCTTGSVVLGAWNTQANAASIVKIVPGNGSFVVTSTVDVGVGTFNYLIMK